MVRFLPAGSRARVLAVLCGIPLGLGAYTAYYAEGASYLSNDPRACVNCHVMRDVYDGWQKGGHHTAATCNDCHVPHDAVGKWWTKGRNGWRHSKEFTLQDFHEPIRIRPENREILRASCVRCHEAFVSEVLHGGGRPAESLDCLHCHGDVGHGPLR